jgi:hypothetical protein
VIGFWALAVEQDEACRRLDNDPRLRDPGPIDLSMLRVTRPRPAPAPTLSAAAKRVLPAGV